jgi:hypothetical protein
MLYFKCDSPILNRCSQTHLHIHVLRYKYNYSYALPNLAAIATCVYLLGSDVKASNCKFVLSCSESWRTNGLEEGTALLRVCRHYVA